MHHTPLFCARNSQSTFVHREWFNVKMRFWLLFTCLQLLYTIRGEKCYVKRFVKVCIHNIHNKLHIHIFYMNIHIYLCTYIHTSSLYNPLQRKKIDC